MVVEKSSLVPHELLARADKILFIAHLAIGDFAYLQSCLRSFAAAFPHVKIHLWVDELRRTSREEKWGHLKNYVIYDWVENCSFIEKVYRETYSPELFRKSVREAQSEQYPVIVSLAVLHRKFYANLARKINRNALVAGQVKKRKFYDVFAYLAYRKLDVKIPAYRIDPSQPRHISDIYAEWFSSLFACRPTREEQAPFLDIPPSWRNYAANQFEEWRISDRPVLFLNSYSKGEQRTWPIERVFELIREIRRNKRWPHVGMIVNVVPEEYAKVNALLESSGLRDVHLFSATENFFQLPAIMERCHLIVTVETAIMHLANAVHVPVIAMMRRANPEWRPFDVENSTIITVSAADDRISAIGVAEIMEVLSEARFSSILASHDPHVLPKSVSDS